MNPQRFNALTGIRAIAAVMVFVYHNRKYWRADLPDWLNRFYNELHTGVSVFFVLSGFLIVYTYKDKPIQSVESYCRYMGLRLARIFPVYLLIIFTKYFVEGFPSAKETFLTLSLFHGFSDQYNLNGIPQAWSLTVELSFYTLAPILYFLYKKNPIKALIFLLLFLLLTIAIGYTWHYVNGNKDRFLYPWFFILNTCFSGRFFEFFCGMYLADLLLNRKLSWLDRIKMKTWIGLLLMLMVIFILGLFEPNIYKHGTDHPVGLLIRNFVFPIPVIILLYGLIKEENYLQRFLSTKLMVLLGNASFIFYLIHIGFVNLRIRGWQYFWDRNFLLLWIISILGYILIEKQIYSVLKKMIQGRTPANYNNNKPVTQDPS